MEGEAWRGGSATGGGSVGVSTGMRYSWWCWRSCRAIDSEEGGGARS